MYVIVYACITPNGLLDIIVYGSYDDYASAHEEAVRVRGLNSQQRGTTQIHKISKEFKDQPSWVHSV